MITNVMFLLPFLSTTVYATLLKELDIKDAGINKTPIASPTLPRDGNFRFLFGVSFTALSLNFLACSLVISHTLYKYQKSETRKLAMSYRLPLYTAITDFLIMSIVTSNLSYPLINSTTWPVKPCAAIAMFANVAVTANHLLFTILAVTTYLKVTQRIEIVDFGRYDWKLFATIFGLPLTAYLPAVTEVYGSAGYWCSIKSSTSIYAYWNIIEIVMAMSISTFCYIQIIRIVYMSRKEVSMNSTGVNIELRVTRKISSYLSVFLTQWIFTAVYVFAFIVQIQAIWPLVVVVVGVNFGGIGNAVVYSYLERLIGSRKSSTNMSDITIVSGTNVKNKRSNQMQIIVVK